MKTQSDQHSRSAKSAWCRFKQWVWAIAGRRRSDDCPAASEQTRIALLNVLVARQRQLVAIFANDAARGLCGQSVSVCANCCRPYWSRDDRKLCPPCDPSKPEYPEDAISREGWLRRDWKQVDPPAR